MQQLNDLSIQDQSAMLNAIRANLLAECREESAEASVEGDPRRGWLIVSDE